MLLGVWDFIRHYGIVLALVVAMIIALGYLLARISYHFGRLRDVESRYLDGDTVDMLERVIRFWALAFLGIYVLFIGSAFIPWVRQNIWPIFLDYFPILLVVTLIILMAIFISRIVKRLIQYLMGSLRDKPKKVVRPQMLVFAGILIKYIIYGVAGILCIVVVMTTLPDLRDAVYGGVSDFALRNVHFIGFLIALAIAAYFANRFIQAFIADYARGSSSKFHPELVEMGGKIIGWGIYAFAAVLVIFTILSMANLGQLGQTMLILISTMLGLVVAFAATGSIGNAISGMVLMSFKPFDAGDRIRLKDGATVDVVEQNMIFTKVRTLQGVIVEMPNNEILAGAITNLSKSVPFAISISASIGYDVKVDRVRELMVAAAMKTEGIIAEPRPMAYATELDNYYVVYELDAYTDLPKEIRRVRSALITSIQMEFDEANVEILSPMWNAVRRDDKWSYAWPSGKRGKGA